MVVLAVENGECIQLGLEPGTAAQHRKLAAPPVGDILARNVPVEGVILQHYLLGAILADDKEGRAVLPAAAAGAASSSASVAPGLTLELRIVFFAVQADRIVELDCN